VGAAAGIAWGFLHYQRCKLSDLSVISKFRGPRPLWDNVAQLLDVKRRPNLLADDIKVLGSKVIGDSTPNLDYRITPTKGPLARRFSIPLAQTRSAETSTIALDALSFCTFGDASLNHSTSQGHVKYTGVGQPTKTHPYLSYFVCED